jgi:hypothetical protein
MADLRYWPAIQEQLPSSELECWEYPPIRVALIREIRQAEDVGPSNMLGDNCARQVTTPAGA